MNEANSTIQTNEEQESRQGHKDSRDFFGKFFPKLDIWDKKTTTALYNHENLLKQRKIWQFISFLGDPREWLIVVVILGIYGLIIHDFTLFAIFFTGFFQSFASYFFIKYTVKRPRPFKQDSTIIRLDSTGHGYSFPSGHCHHSTILFGLITLLWLPTWVFSLVIILNLLIGFSRIMLGCHYISDTIIGIIEAYLELIIFWLFAKDIYVDLIIHIQNLIF
ncbi:MAG: hypothetical protein DRO88_05340 [Promethearchaeia archaeon]|nr:MAG: hypothetical protein DRO88_05340 [Candidatus Lokiarchaeia archaeon]